MSATGFQRHRRAVAVKYIQTALGKGGKSADQVKDIMQNYNLAPADLATLENNNDVLNIADDLAAAHLQEPELDSLEEMDVLNVGDRAAVHSPDVRADQFNPNLQHPCQETMAVGNMHDGPEAAEAIANVSAAHVEAAGGLAEAAQEKADLAKEITEDPSAAAAAAFNPAAADGAVPGEPTDASPSTTPAADEQTAEDDQPTDPTGTQDTPATVVDGQAAADAIADRDAAAEKLAKQGEKALRSMKRDELLAYAEGQRITLTDIKPRTTLDTIVDQILAAQGDTDNG